MAIPGEEVRALNRPCSDSRRARCRSRRQTCGLKRRDRGCSRPLPQDGFNGIRCCDGKIEESRAVKAVLFRQVGYGFEDRSPEICSWAPRNQAFPRSALMADEVKELEEVGLQLTNLRNILDG